MEELEYNEEAGDIIMNEDTKNPTPKHPLGQGDTLVWKRGDETIIHHTNGLTIGLNPQEAAELLEWLQEQQARHATQA